VTDTILGVAALDDVLGILLFSFTITIIFIFTKGEQIGLFGNPVINSLYEVMAAIGIGTFIGIVIDPLSKFLPIKGEGQWVVIIFALLIFCVGISKALQIDILLSSMTMGMVVVNKCKQQKVVFKILERYTEDLIFLFFFLLSGLHLDLSTILQATAPILVFVLLRVTGKIIGANLGARVVKANHSIQKYVAGGLFPQAGIVIGLVLSIYQKERFKEISELLLTIIIGATVIHELLGPVAAKYSLMKAKEIKESGT
jgi:Kef-type K+ transport system membrane component KefB